MIILGVHYSHDAGAAIIKDGAIVAAVNEERYTREKLYWGFPKHSLKNIFSLAGISPKDIDYVAFANKTPGGGPQRSFDKPTLRKYLMDKVANTFPYVVGSNLFVDKYRAFYSMFRRGKGVVNYLKKLGVEAPIYYVDHHMCHAASAYYTSGFSKNTLVVTTDGSGDGLCSTVSLISDDFELKPIAMTPFFHSPATIYAYVTHNLGFVPNKHEGKITGLAAYGKPEVTYGIFADIMNVSGLQYKTKRIKWGRPASKRLHMVMQHKKWEDIAAGLQKRFEEVCCGLVSNALKKYPASNIALAGGGFANVKANQRIAELSSIKKVFIHPHMGDGGLSVGAALFLWADLMLDKGNKPKPIAIDNVYFGPEYSNEEIEKTLTKYNLKYKYTKDIEDEIAHLIHNKKIIGRFNGKMEYGPRALGNRSILASPKDKTINDWLNKRLNRCYDDKTEILTNEGWKFFEHLKEDEIVATLNPKTNELEYNKIKAKVKYYYNGELIHFKNKRIDLLVTPNHKLWVKKRRSNEFSFEYAENLLYKRHRQLKGDVKWKGDNKKKFVLPSIKFRKSFKPKLSINMNLWLEFLGYWIAEGSVHYDKKGHYVISVAQSKRSKYYKDIETCLKKLPFNVLYDIKEFKIYNKQLYEYLEPLKGARNKFIPREFLELSKKQLEILFIALNKGDGNIRGKQYRYATTSKKLASNVQEIALKLSYSSYVSTQKSRNEKHADLYLVRIGRSSISYVRDKQSSRANYKGYVYCVTVSNHIIFVRRNGKPVFCGNSEFMPFAPSVMEERAKDIYKNFSSGEIAAKFMTMTFDVHKKWVDVAPAVVHIDNTARPQTVTREQNKSYYNILKAYKDVSGLPMFVNTSFNMHEEPIICSPLDAVRAFKQGSVDVLAIGNYLSYIKK